MGYGLRPSKKKTTVRAGPTKSLPERWIGHAPLNFTYFGVIFGHDVHHAPTHKLKAGLFNCCFCRRDKMAEITIRKKTKATITFFLKEKRNRPAFS